MDTGPFIGLVFPFKTRGIFIGEKNPFRRNSEGISNLNLKLQLYLIQLIPFDVHHRGIFDVSCGIERGVKFIF